MQQRGNYWYINSPTAAGMTRYVGYNPGIGPVPNPPVNFTRAPIEQQAWDYRINEHQRYTFTFGKNFFKKHVISLPKDENEGKANRTERAALLIQAALLFPTDNAGAYALVNQDRRFTGNGGDPLNPIAPQNLNMARAKLLMYKMKRLVEARTRGDLCRECSHRANQHPAGGACNVAGCGCPHHISYVDSRLGKPVDDPLAGARTEISSFLVLDFIDPHPLLASVLQSAQLTEDTLPDRAIARQIGALLAQVKDLARTPALGQANTAYTVDDAQNGISCHWDWQSVPPGGPLVQNATGAAVAPLVGQSYREAHGIIGPAPGGNATVISYNNRGANAALTDDTDDAINVFLTAYAAPGAHQVAGRLAELQVLQGQLHYPGGSFTFDTHMPVLAELMPASPHGDEHHYQVFHYG